MSYLEQMAKTALSKRATKIIQFNNGPFISVTTFGDQQSASVCANNGQGYNTEGASDLVSTIEEVLSACENLDESDYKYSKDDVEWLLSLFED